MVVVVLLIILGVAAGAGLRLALDRVVERRCGRLVIAAVGVHLGGSAVLGFIFGLPSAYEWADPISTCCCGVFAGYAIVGVETLRLMRQASFLAPALAAAQMLSALGIGSVAMALAGLLTPN